MITERREQNPKEKLKLDGLIRDGWISIRSMDTE